MFYDHHVFVPVTRFMATNGDMTLVNALMSHDREKLSRSSDPLAEWLFTNAAHGWGWMVMEDDPNYLSFMENKYGENWPEWRDHYAYLTVRFSFYSRDDALLFKLTCL